MEQDKMYFITATILEWKHLLADDKFKDILINEWRHRVKLNHIKVYGFVVMPNHYHAIINTLSPHDPSDIQRDIHKWTSKQFINDLKLNNPKTLDLYAVNAKDRKYQIWERNSLPILLYSRSVIEQKLRYIHENPLQAHWKLAETPEDYYYSSAGFYERNDMTWDFLTSIYE
jgi:putative transposase